MTLARFFIKLRSDAGLSLRAVAMKSKPRLDPTTLWKIENGKPVRAVTLGQALRAIGLKEKDDAYVEAFSLWSMEQSQTLTLEAVDRGLSRARGANAKAFQAIIDKIATALRKMPEGDWPAVLEAAEHPAALKLWLESARLARK